MFKGYPKDKLNTYYIIKSITEVECYFVGLQSVTLSTMLCKQVWYGMAWHGVACDSKTLLSF